MIRKEYIDKFKKLYKDKYNIALSDDDATELATHFLNLMEILIKPKRNKEASSKTLHKTRVEGSQYETCRL